MPIKRTYKKKSQYKRKGKYIKRGKKPYVGRMIRFKNYMSDIPQRLFTKLSYSRAETGTLSTGNTPISTFTFTSGARDKGLFENGSDPFIHYPHFFKRWGLLYDRYRVHGIKYKVEVHNYNTNEQFFVCVSDYVDGEGQLTSIVGMLETRLATKVRVGGSVNSGHERVFLKGYMSCSKVFGVDKQAYRTDPLYSGATDSLTGNIASYPITSADLTVYIQSALDNTPSMTFGIVVNLIYYVEFYNRRNVTTDSP